MYGIILIIYHNQYNIINILLFRSVKKNILVSVLKIPKYEERVSNT